MHEASDELSLRQQVQLEVLVEAFHDKHSEDADPREILLAKSIRLEWIAFSILYPKMSFLLVKVDDVIREVDAMFLHEFQLKDEEMNNPVEHVLNYNHLNVWKNECSMIFGMGLGSFLWNNKIWELENQIKRTQDGHLMAELEADTASLHEPLRSQMKEAIDAIKPRLDYLDRCKIMIKRLEDASEPAQRAISQPLEAPDSSEIHELPEHGEQSVVVQNNNTASATDDHSEEADAPVEASSTAIDVSPSNRQSRKRRGKSQRKNSIIEQ
ncbi:MAG: hypothetical protein M1825_000326 [Sarcosagium campestre]|nr:MAG: hypothetical protein M1825_000326 [Sarcosagium campestre]